MDAIRLYHLIDHLEDASRVAGLLEDDWLRAFMEHHLDIMAHIARKVRDKKMPLRKEGN